jgi:single-strand DNA-binding protein
MRNLNAVHLIGRVGREPALRYGPDGQPVTTLSVATDRPGEKDSATVEWHRVVLRGRLAEIANRYLGRGRLIYIAGRLTYRQWQDAEGHRRQITEIAASDLVLLDHRPKARAPQPPGDQTDGDALPF